MTGQARGGGCRKCDLVVFPTRLLVHQRMNANGITVATNDLFS
jgi:hypothetical protein